MVLTDISPSSEFDQFKAFTARKLPAKKYFMTRGQFRIKFIGKIRKESFVTLYLQCFINGEQTRINTGIRIEKKFWDSKRGEIKKNHPDSKDLNLLLEQQRSKATKIAIEFRMGQRLLTKEKFIREWEDPLARLSFTKFYEAEINERFNRGDIAPGTLKQHKVTLTKLKGFREEIMFNEINLDLVYLFEGHMRNKLNNGSTPVKTSMKNFKTYINRAIAKGIKVDNPFDKGLYKVGRHNQRIIWLTQDEVHRLEEYYHSSFIPDRYRNVLQGFLFACYTGLRFSDINRVTRSNITPDNTLRFMPFKTRRYEKIVEIPLIDQAVRYLSDNQNKMFDHLISEQKTNAYLKEIASICNIKKRVSTHVARHTFGSLYIESGGKVTTLQQLLGHSNIQDTMIYVHINDKTKESEMQNFGDFQKR